MCTIRPSSASARMLRGDVVAADHVEDQVGAALGRHHLDEILVAVVDRPLRAEAACRRRISPSDPAVVNTRAPKACASWIAVVPIPDEPPWTRNRSPAFKPAAHEHVGPDGEEGLGQAGRLAQVHALGHRQGMGRRAWRRIRHSRRRAAARRPCRPPASRSRRARSPTTSPAASSPGRSLAPWRRGVGAGALQRIGPVHARQRRA